MAARNNHDDDDHDYDDAEDGAAEGDDGGGGEGARIRSLDDLSAAIERLEQRVSRAFSGGSRSRPEPGGSGSSPRPTQADNADARRREIREELAALRGQEKADAERGDLMTRLGKVEKSLERAPRQLRRVEEMMGWGKP
ncbi:MAG TPA: hypothetical protein VGI05_26585 [Streptosporangiaceae bacterium]|jgi:hypothetical protein